MQLNGSRPASADDDHLQFGDYDHAEAIAGALARVRVARRRVARARVALQDAAIDLERELRYAHSLGSSLSDLEEPSGLSKSHIGDLVIQPPRERPDPSVRCRKREVPAGRAGVAPDH